MSQTQLEVSEHGAEMVSVQAHGKEKMTENKRQVDEGEIATTGRKPQGE